LPSVRSIPPTVAGTRVQRSLFPVIAVALLLLVAVLALRPVVAHWHSVEAPLQTARAQVARLQRLVNNQPAVDSAIQHRAQDLVGRPQRVLQARSRSLAASALQSMVLELAESSNVTIIRLDVAASDSLGDLPFDLSANGDIYGLANLLQRIRTAPFVVVVRKVQVQNNSALRGAPDVLQIALSLQAPVIVP